MQRSNFVLQGAIIFMVVLMVFSGLYAQKNRQIYLEPDEENLGLMNYSAEELLNHQVSALRANNINTEWFRQRKNIILEKANAVGGLFLLVPDTLASVLLGFIGERGNEVYNEPINLDGISETGNRCIFGIKMPCTECDNERELQHGERNLTVREVAALLVSFKLKPRGTRWAIFPTQSIYNLGHGTMVCFVQWKKEIEWKKEDKDYWEVKSMGRYDKILHPACLKETIQ